MSVLSDIALILLGYRWLAVLQRGLQVVAYGLFLLALVPLLDWAEQMALTPGTFIFQHGCTIAWDLVYGEGLFVVPFLVYERLRLRVTSTAGARQKLPL